MTDGPPKRSRSTDTDTDTDLLDASPSAGWLDTYRAMAVDPPDDVLAAALRADRPKSYRIKHLLGCTS